MTHKRQAERVLLGCIRAVDLIHLIQFNSIQFFASSVLSVPDNKRKVKIPNGTDLSCKHRMKKIYHLSISREI